MNPMQSAKQQLSLALQQNDAQQRMIAHITERLAIMEEAGKIGDEKVQLLTTQLNSAASMLSDVSALAAATKTHPNSVRSGTRLPTPLPSPAYLAPCYHGSIK
jgi:hypothetical protein